MYHRYGPVPAKNTKVDAVRFVLIHGFFSGVQEPFTIIRMYAIQKQLVACLSCGRIVADDAIQLVGPGHPARGYVSLPTADMGNSL